MEAIRRHYVTDGEAALAELSPPTRRVAEAIGWRELYLADLDVLRGQFLRMYDRVAERERQEALLPVSWRRELEHLGDRAGAPPALSAGIGRSML
jgi:hypothetical protein